MPRFRLSWCDMPMRSTWALSTNDRPSGSWRRCGNGCRSSRYRCIRKDTADRVRSLRGQRPSYTWLGKRETFSFLGFTHICSHSREGHPSAQAVDTPGTDSDKIASDQRAVEVRMHEPIPMQGKWLGPAALPTQLAQRRRRSCATKCSIPICFDHCEPIKSLGYMNLR